MQRDYLNSSKIPIKKSWGQNFLIDPNTINKIIRIVNPSQNDNIIEIGPGRGALTIPLSKKCSNIKTIEIDPLLCNYLNKLNLENIEVYNEDILKWNFIKNNQSNIKLVGNLPYYITSPIIFKFLSLNFWDEMVFMVQKEVGDRIISKNNSKNYSRISVMCQTFCKVTNEFNISKNVFKPKPKVDSCLIKFIKKKISLDINEYSDFIKKCFSKKRKILRNNLKDYINLNKINDFHNKRAEQISIEEFIEIFKKISI